jgi:hypothetical protein
MAKAATPAINADVCCGSVLEDLRILPRISSIA